MWLAAPYFIITTLNKTMLYDVKLWFCQNSSLLLVNKWTTLTSFITSWFQRGYNDKLSSVVTNWIEDLHYTLQSRLETTLSMILSKLYVTFGNISRIEILLTSVKTGKMKGYNEPVVNYFNHSEIDLRCITINVKLVLP